MKIFPQNFQGLLKTLSAVNTEILVKKFLSVVEKLHFVQWDIFLSHMVRSSRSIAHLLHVLQSQSTKYK